MGKLYDHIVFVDALGHEHTKGALIGVWYENHETGSEVHSEECKELLLYELNEITALLKLAQDTYGHWYIKNGEVVPAKRSCKK